MSMIFKNIPSIATFVVCIAGSVAIAQEAQEVPADEAASDDSVLLDQVVPVAVDDASEESAAEEASPAGPPAQTNLDPKAELLQQFDNYKRLMNEGIYDEADTVAKRIVTLAIQITGPQSSETAKALTNLGIVQHRNKQFDAAAQNFASAIEIIEVIEDRLNGRLINPLKGLGAAQLEAGRPDLAKQTFNRAVHITHVNDGPHNMGQIEILESLAETSVRLGSVEEARAMHDKIYLLHQRRYEDDQLALIPSLMRRAEWQHRAGYISDEQATYRRAIRIIETNADKKDFRLIEPLTRLGQSYFFKDIHAEQGLHHSPVTGEIYFKRALRIAEAHPQSNWMIAAGSKLALGDYYMMQNMLTRARKLYGEIWDELSTDEPRLTLRDEIFSLAAPLNDRPLPEFAGESGPSALLGVSEDYDQGSVTVSYSVTNRGRVIEVEAVEVYPPEFTDMQKIVHRELRGRTYRPRYEEAKPVKTVEQVLTHMFYYKQSDLEERRAENLGAEST
jgi:tetratricopeptide (TPR) repeat protein